jgi:MFS family permease
VTLTNTHPTAGAVPVAAATAGKSTAGSGADPARTLSIATAGTLLVLAVLSAFVVTVSDSAHAPHAGVAGETWALTGMSLGLAAALLTAGALADDVGHRRVLEWSAGLLAVASVLGALAPTMSVLVAARVLQGVALAIGLGLAAAGEIALTGLGTGSNWARLLPGLVVAGIGSGIANAALGRLAVESVPHDRVGMGSGANNTARYLGGAAGVAPVVSLAAGAGPAGMIRGWDVAALVSAVLCALGAVMSPAAARARHWPTRRDDASDVTATPCPSSRSVNQRKEQR